jgi:hypothetical protein
MCIKRTRLLTILFLVPLFLAVADDTVVPFDESWAINVSLNFAIISFIQGQSTQYTADMPWSVGIGLRYKNMTSVNFLLPSFYDFDTHPFESFDIQLASYYDFIYYEVFCKRYQGFTEGEVGGEPGNKNVNLRLFTTGISAGWLPNGKNHSLSAVYDLNCRQLSSSGSPILGFGIFYTSLFSMEENIQRYNTNQHLIYFGPNIGYSYSFIFSNSIFLNMNLVIGFDAGINTNTGKWLFVPLVMPKISFGHHNNTWSINVTGGCDYTVFLWDINSIDNLMPATIAVTFSKRFK